MPSCSEPAIGWPPTKRAAASGRARFDLGDDRALHRADVGDERRAGVERLRPPASATRPDRHRDDDEVGAARPRRRASARPSLDRAELLGARRARARVAVEADDLVAAAGEREPDRAADEAGPDDGDAHPDYSGQVVAQRPRALEVHVVELGARTGRS